MKKALAIVLLLSLFSFSLMGCQQTAAAPAGNTAGDTIKIGWIGSLTGPQAVWGTCERDTLQMMIDDVNTAGGWLGKKLELVPYDSQGKPEEALNSARRLVEQDKVVAIIGPNASGQVIAMTPALENSKVPDIATVATNPKVTVENGKLKEFNFRVCFIDPYQGAVAAGYSFDVLGKKKAAILYDQSDDYSTGLMEFFEKTFTEKGGQIVAKEAFNKGDQEFKTQLTKIKDANPDILFLPFFFNEVALTAKQASELGIKIPMIGGDGWPSEQLLELAKDEIQGSYFVNHLDYEDPSVQEFRKAYEGKFGKAPELNGFLAYDALKLLEVAVLKAGEANSIKIAQALNGAEVQGITGMIKISPETHNPEGKDAAILKIEGENYVFQQKYSAE